MTLDPIRPYLSAIKAGACVLLLAVAWWHGFDTGRDRWQGKFDTEAAAHAADKARHASVLRDLADKTKAAERAVLVAGDWARAERATNDQRFRDAKRDADHAKRDLAHALRTGAVRLRDEWACHSPRPAEGGIATATSGQDAAADLRQAGAADLIAAADHADRWIVWLQTELTSTRNACAVVSIER